MTIKYECDICGKQFSSEADIEFCYRDVVKNPLVFDVCKECAKKLYKPVKKYHTIINVDMEEEK